MAHTDVAASGQWHRRVARIAVLGAAGALAIGASAATVAGASMTKAKKPATTKKVANPYLKVENQLNSLEKPPSGVSLLETGSTLLYPLVSNWASAYSAVHVTTAGTGSGTGIADATNGTVQIGASDAYLPPTAPSTLLNIPVDVSAQQINYNVRGLPKGTHLRLDGKVLNDIYNGSVTKWNAPEIASLNKGVSLPDETIVPIHRLDGSGDTFLFSTYLADQDPSGWVNAGGGPGTSVHWPSVPGGLGEIGNGAMLAACEKTAGCIAYIGVSWLRSSIQVGLGYAQLLNGTGHYVQPTSNNISAEVASYKKIPANAAISLINSKKAKFGYPIVNFEYAIVSEHQPSTTTAKAVKAFLAWGMDPRHGSATRYLAPIYFHPLAPGAMQIAVNLLKKVS